MGAQRTCIPALRHVNSYPHFHIKSPWSVLGSHHCAAEEEAVGFTVETAKKRNSWGLLACFSGRLSSKREGAFKSRCLGFLPEEFRSSRGLRAGRRGAAGTTAGPLGTEQSEEQTPRLTRGLRIGDTKHIIS